MEVLKSGACANYDVLEDPHARCYVCFIHKFADVKNFPDISAKNSRFTLNKGISIHGIKHSRNKTLNSRFHSLETANNPQRKNMGEGVFDVGMVIKRKKRVKKKQKIPYQASL